MYECINPKYLISACSSALASPSWATCLVTCTIRIWFVILKKFAFPQPGGCHFIAFSEAGLSTISNICIVDLIFLSLASFPSTRLSIFPSFNLPSFFCIPHFFVKLTHALVSVLATYLVYKTDYYSFITALLYHSLSYPYCMFFLFMHSPFSKCVHFHLFPHPLPNPFLLLVFNPFPPFSTWVVVRYVNSSTIASKVF